VLQPALPGQVALLMGDDTEGSPLYLYVGEKNAAGDGSFLDRNGLKVGRLYAWKADNGDLTPEQFKGLGASRSGTFVEIVVKDPLAAGLAGHDAQGYLDNDGLTSQADALGCYSFARPEDLDTNPYDGTQAAFVSTGRGSLFPSDNWGDVYVVDVDFSDLSADVRIVHDADGLAVPDAGIRSPDNIDWGKDGKLYVTEDRATTPGTLFGAATGAEASLWRLDPITQATQRIGEIDRSAVSTGSTDPSPSDLGNWETTGVTDVTGLFGTLPGERLLLVNVQAHSLQDGPIGGNPLLDEGGQLLFASKVGE
jgi:secreted PhoX family phosphatase